MSLCLCLCSLSVSVCLRVCVCVFGSAWMRTMCLAVERWLTCALRHWPSCAQITRTHLRPILHLPAVGRSSTLGRHLRQQSRGCRAVPPINASNTCLSSEAFARGDISPAQSFNLSSSSPPDVMAQRNAFTQIGRVAQNTLACPGTHYALGTSLTSTISQVRPFPGTPGGCSQASRSSPSAVAARGMGMRVLRIG
eukprot:COSAG06_NODE_22245_length_729_cov_13.374603_1_plen_194_part_10